MKMKYKLNESVFEVLEWDYLCNFDEMLDFIDPNRELESEYEFVDDNTKCIFNNYGFTVILEREFFILKDKEGNLYNCERNLFKKLFEEIEE